MACRNQSGPSAICTFIQRYEGSEISQTDWHGVKVLAEESGADVSRTRLSEDEKRSLAQSLAEAFETYPDSAPNAAGYRDLIRSRLSDDLAEVAITRGTAAIVTYLLSNGVRQTLEQVREGQKIESLRAAVDIDNLPSASKVSNLDQLEAKYEDIRRESGLLEKGELKCRYCGSRRTQSLLLNKQGEVACGQCSRGGEGDNFTGGTWLFPSKKELRMAKRADRKSGNRE